MGYSFNNSKYGLVNNGYAKSHKSYPFLDELWVHSWMCYKHGNYPILVQRKSKPKNNNNTDGDFAYSL